jgi:hypothetical protein
VAVPTRLHDGACTRILRNCACFRLKADFVTGAGCNPIMEYPKKGYDGGGEGGSLATRCRVRAVSLWKNERPLEGTTVPTDDSARLRAVIDQIANALQPAVVLAGQLHRMSATTVQDIANLDSALARVVTILKTAQSDRSE